MRTCILLLLFMVGQVLGKAQEPSKVPYFWVGLGTGACGVQNEHPELASGFFGNVELKRQLVGVRYLRNKEFVLFATPHQINEVALLWGKYYLGLEGDFYASWQVGPAVETYYTYGAVKPNPSSGGFGTYHYLVPNSVAGIAIDTHAGFNFGRFFSLGIYGFANLNLEKIIGGVMFDLRCGFVRSN